jgi:hypothetical protein
LPYWLALATPTVRVWSAVRLKAGTLNVPAAMVVLPL